MIEQWNRNPDQVPPEVDETLVDILASERTFEVVVSLSKKDQTADTVPDSEATVKVPPVDGGKNPGTETEEKHDRSHKIRFFPFVLPGYFWSVINKRRRNGIMRDESVSPSSTGRISPRTMPGGLIYDVPAIGTITPNRVTGRPIININGGGNSGIDTIDTPLPGYIPPRHPRSGTESTPVQPHLRRLRHNGGSTNTRPHSPDSWGGSARKVRPGWKHKQPRPFNYSGILGENRSVKKGGIGRQSRSHGGNRG